MSSEKKEYGVDNLIKQIDRKIFEKTIADIPTNKYELFSRVIVVNSVKEKTIQYTDINTGKKHSITADRTGEYWTPYIGKKIIVDGAYMKVSSSWMIKEVIELYENECLEKYFTDQELKDRKADFMGLNKSQQEDVLRVLKEGKVWCEEKKNDRVSYLTFTELVSKFNLCKKYYPPIIKREIENIIATYSKAKMSEKETLARTMEYLVNIPLHMKPINKISSTDIRKGLDSTHYGLNNIKEKLISYALFKNKTDNVARVNTILLDGKTGSGKTTLLQSLAAALGIPCVIIQLAGMNDATVLRGVGKNYGNGDAGRIVRELYRNGMRMMLVFEDIDKVANEEVINTLMPLFDKREVTDEFLEFPIELGEECLIFATCNHTRNINPELLSRMEVVTFNGYSQEEKEQIVSQYMLPKICKDLELEDLEMTKDAIKALACDYVLSNDNIREVQKNMEVLESYMKKCKRKPRCVTRETIEKLLGGDELQSLVREPEMLKKKYLQNKFDYTVEIRQKIEEDFALLDDTKDEAEKSYAIKSLYYLVNILKGEQKEICIEELKKAMNETHFGMDIAKREILRCFVRCQLQGQSRYKAILLNGAPGIGKTTIAKTIAKALDIPYAKVSLNGVSDVDTLTGVIKTFKGADAGMIVQTLAQPNIASYTLVLLLDEIDKMQSRRNDDPYAALYNLLDNADGFYDKFLDVNIPTEHILFIATSNDKTKVPQTILNRMEVIELGGYSTKEKICITTNYVIPKKLSEFHLKGKVIFAKDTIEQIVNIYCQDFGIRDVERAIDTVISEAMLNGRLKGKKRIVITDKDLQCLTAVRRTANTEKSNVESYGIANALAVSGGYGLTFPIQIVKNLYGKGMEITGLPKNSTMESIKVAITVASRILEREVPDLHIHFGNAGVEKDGPSAGITIFAALMSMLYEEALPNVAFTGELDLMGNVLPVGGIKLKIIAAEKSEFDKVYIPMENYAEIEKELNKYSIQIVPVENVEQLRILLFKRENCKKIL